MSNIYKDKITDEWYYPENEYILSGTDDKGIIIYVNGMFCEVAGYKKEEHMKKIQVKKYLSTSG